jgi:hypothetical protein
MAKKKPIHSAAQSAAGYLYQARFALSECLRFVNADSGIEVAIEKLDDVSFEKDGNAMELLQTKHHLKKSGDLTDKSPDLWKTLRVWSEVAKNDPSLPGRTRFILVTTASAPQKSAASFLYPVTKENSARNIDEAEKLLLAASASSDNKELEKAFEAFNALTPAMRKALIGSIEILDGAPLISDLEAVIEDQLRLFAPRGKASLAREQIEGWWWPRICKVLQSEQPQAISIIEVEQKLDDIRDSLRRDALLLDMEHANPTESELFVLEEMRFVNQLRSVGVGNTRIAYAKRDYYRAFTQRSKWTRQNLLFDGEVSRFEKHLVEEWEPRFAQMCDSLTSDSLDGTMQQEAQKLYFWVESEARFPFRTITSRFLSVGSYHIMANDLRIGWHRDYQTLFADKG